MNNINTFKNTIKEIEVDGHIFKVDQLTVIELYSKCQDEYKKFKMKDALMISGFLAGREKIDFLKEVMKEQSTGEKLALEIQDYIQSTDGILMLLKFIINKDNPDLTENQIVKIISPSSIEEYKPIYNYALSGIEYDEEDEVDENTEESEFELAKKKS